MKKNDYLSQLRVELKKRNVKNVEAIIEDYDDLFYQKVNDGKNELDIIKELGSPSYVASLYGDSQPQQGSSDILKFILLQIFNLIIGIPILSVIISFIIGFVVIIVTSIATFAVTIYGVLVNTFTVWEASAVVITIALFTIFCISLSIILLKLCYMLIYNYILYNINLLKKNKLYYGRIRASKALLITTSVSLLLAIVATSVTAALFRSSNNYVDFSDLVYKMSITSVNVESELSVVNEFDDSIKNIEINGVPNVEIVHGDENKIESNYAIDYRFFDDTLIIDDSINGRMTFGFFDEGQNIVITTTNEIETLSADAINIEITDVNAEEYMINAINVDIDEEDSDNIKFIDVTSTNLDLNVAASKLTNNELKVKIDTINCDALIENYNLKVYTVDAHVIDTELNNVVSEKIYIDAPTGTFEISDSKLDKFDVKSLAVGYLELENSTIDKLVYDKYKLVIDSDEKSKYKEFKEE